MYLRKGIVSAKDAVSFSAGALLSVKKSMVFMPLMVIQ